MTSLYIVNKQIELINNQLNDYDEEDEEYGFYPSYDILMCELNNYNEIKQDLEILEIIIFISKNGFDINCLDDNQSKKLNDFLNKICDSHE